MIIQPSKDTSANVIDFDVLLIAYLYVNIKLYKSAKTGDKTKEI